MDFRRRNINKVQRNGELIAYNVSSFSSKLNGGSSSSSNSGSYLPATNNGDGTYTVDLTSVLFNGNVIAAGEVAAYLSGNTDASGSTTVGNVVIEDNLTSTATTAALSANQGRILKDLINEVSGKTSGVTSGTTGETVTELSKLKDVLISNPSNNQIIQYDSYSAKWVNKNLNTEVSALTQHINDKVIHITETDRTNWDNKLNKSVWDDVFEIDSNGNLKVKVNLYGQGEISAYGSGITGSTTEINLENYYTKDEIDDKLDNLDIGDIDLSEYSKTSHTHSNYALSNHTHTNYSVTSHTHAQYASSSHTHSISNITNLQTTLDGKSGTGHSHSNYSLTSHTHSAYAGTGHSHSNYATTTNFNSHSGNTTLHITAAERTAWNAKSDAHSHPYASSSHTHSNYSVTSHTHNYAGSSSAGGAATSANKVNSTLTFTGGTFAAKTFNGSAATTVNIPTHTSHITNNSGFITTAATVANANYATSAGSATNATTASKLSTVSKTAWGQTFWTSGGIPASISGNMTGVGSISASGNITTSAEVTAHSDKRLKDNIQPLTNRGYITPTTYIKDGKQSIGFIAQDMQKLYPELVTVDESTEEKYLTVNYMQYTAVLQAQIIELSKEIQELKDKLNDIYNKEK